jgi:uncharacterized membrane protein YphA (DoxX/SURF4 family)
LVWGDFALQWQPVSATLPGRTALAYAVAALLVSAGLGLNGRRHVAVMCAAALGGFYLLVTFVLHGPDVAAHPKVFATWSGAAEQLALAAAGLVAFASIHAALSATQVARLLHTGQITFAICLLGFGIAHFLYIDFTASMVPKWIPAGQMFWAWATGFAHIAAGLAILFRVQARLAAVLVTVMFIAFGLLVHAPLLLADASSHLNWVSNAMNLALTGAAWTVADSVRREHAPN